MERESTRWTEKEKKKKKERKEINKIFKLVWTLQFFFLVQSQKVDLALDPPM